MDTPGARVEAHATSANRMEACSTWTTYRAPVPIETRFSRATRVFGCRVPSVRSKIATACFCIRRAAARAPRSTSRDARLFSVIAKSG